MRLIRLHFAAHVVAAQFFFRLRGAEQIRGHFSAAHVVENFLTFLQTLAHVNFPGAEAAVQALVTVVLKHCVVERCDDACIFCISRQLFVVTGKFVANGEPLFVFGQFGKDALLGELLAPGLQGEVGLTMCDHRFGRVGVLYDQVAGVAGEAYIGNAALRTGANVDHFGDITEMVFLTVSGLNASQLRLFDDGHKIAPILIVKDGGKVTRKPELVAFAI